MADYLWTGVNAPSGGTMSPKLLVGVMTVTFVGSRLMIFSARCSVSRQATSGSTTNRRRVGRSCSVACERVQPAPVLPARSARGLQLPCHPWRTPGRVRVLDGPGLGDLRRRQLRLVPGLGRVPGRGCQGHDAAAQAPLTEGIVDLAVVVLTVGPQRHGRALGHKSPSVTRPRDGRAVPSHSHWADRCHRSTPRLVCQTSFSIQLTARSIQVRRSRWSLSGLRLSPPARHGTEGNARKPHASLPTVS